MIDIDQIKRCLNENIVSKIDKKTSLAMVARIEELEQRLRTIIYNIQLTINLADITLEDESCSTKK